MGVLTILFLPCLLLVISTAQPVDVNAATINRPDINPAIPIKHTIRAKHIRPALDKETVDINDFIGSWKKVIHQKDIVISPAIDWEKGMYTSNSTMYHANGCRFRDAQAIEQRALNANNCELICLTAQTCAHFDWEAEDENPGWCRLFEEQAGDPAEMDDKGYVCGYKVSHPMDSTIHAIDWKKDNVGKDISAAMKWKKALMASNEEVMYYGIGCSFNDDAPLTGGPVPLHVCQFYCLNYDVCTHFHWGWSEEERGMWCQLFQGDYVADETDDQEDVCGYKANKNNPTSTTSTIDWKKYSMAIQEDTSAAVRYKRALMESEDGLMYYARGCSFDSDGPAEEGPFPIHFCQFFCLVSESCTNYHWEVREGEEDGWCQWFEQEDHDATETDSQEDICGYKESTSSHHSIPAIYKTDSGSGAISINIDQMISWKGSKINHLMAINHAKPIDHPNDLSPALIFEKGVESDVEVMYYANGCRYDGESFTWGDLTNEVCQQSCLERSSCLLFDWAMWSDYEGGEEEIGRCELYDVQVDPVETGDKGVVCGYKARKPTDLA